MAPEFQKAAHALAVGEIGGPARTRDGHHLIRVTERAQGVARPFGEVREQMRAALRKRAQREKMHAYLDGLKHKARLRVDEAAPAGITPPPPGLGAKYIGPFGTGEDE